MVKILSDMEIEGIRNEQWYKNFTSDLIKNYVKFHSGECENFGTMIVRLFDKKGKSVEWDIQIISKKSLKCHQEDIV